MRSIDFKNWQKRMGWSATEAGRRLGKSTDTISNYRNVGIPEREQTIIGLACAALEAGLKGVGQEP